MIMFLNGLCYKMEFYLLAKESVDSWCGVLISDVLYQEPASSTRPYKLRVPQGSLRVLECMGVSKCLRDFLKWPK